MYEFTLSAKPPVRLCYFIPERVIPGGFYTTHDIEADFEIEAFKPYRIDMDGSLDWITRIHDIILANPEPRTTSRPDRPDPEPSTKAAKSAKPLSLIHI